MSFPLWGQGLRPTVPDPPPLAPHGPAAPGASGHFPALGGGLFSLTTATVAPPLPASVTGATFLTGVALRQRWNLVETADGVFNWANLDSLARYLEVYQADVVSTALNNQLFLTRGAL